jgi:hypothetical protein
MLVKAEVNKLFWLPNTGDKVELNVCNHNQAFQDFKSRIYTVVTMCSTTSDEGNEYTIHPYFYATNRTMLDFSHEVKITYHEDGTYSSIMVKHVPPFREESEYQEEPERVQH